MMKKEVYIPDELFELANSEFDTNWKSTKVTIKRFLREEVGKIEQASIKAKATTVTDFSASVDCTSYRDVTVLIGVAEAPWPINDPSAIKRLPPMIFDWVFKEIQEFNTLSAKKKENLNTLQQEEALQTLK